METATDEDHSIVLVLSSDPGLFHEVFDSERMCLSKGSLASSMYNFHFTTDTNGDKFTSNKYIRDLSNENTIHRN